MGLIPREKWNTQNDNVVEPWLFWIRSLSSTVQFSENSHKNPAFFFFVYETLCFHFFALLMIWSHFWKLTLPVPIHHADILHWKQTTKVIIQTVDRTLRLATRHHRRNGRVHIGSCSPAQFKHATAPALCVQLPSVHTIHPRLQHQTMRDIHHNAQVGFSTMESSSDWESQPSWWFLCWHNHRLLLENETEVRLDVLSL